MDRIKKQVDSIIQTHQTSDPFKICENAGVLVYDLELPDSVNGMYTRINDKDIIILNNSLDFYKRICICAHELGHVFLHEGLNCLDIEKNTNFFLSKFEYEADSFAAYLLLNDSLFNQLSTNETITETQISQLTGVSEHLVHIRFEQIANQTLNVC